jgi:hypothetical protein
MQYATEQVQVEIDQMYLEHQSQVLREGRIEGIYSQWIFCWCIIRNDVLEIYLKFSVSCCVASVDASMGFRSKMRVNRK